MSQFLENFKEYIIKNHINIYHIAQCRGESLPEVLEIQPCNSCNNIYSVSKVFTVTAIGILWDRDLISTEETVTDILRDELPEKYDKRWTRTTVDMLLRHRVGLPAGALDIDSLDASKFKPDYLEELMSLPWDREPGEVFRYTDASYYVLSRIAAKRAGKPLQLFLWEELFLPMAFKEAAWSCCPKGHAMGATGLYAHCEDVVKLGALYLQKGKWQGRQIISENWVNTVLEMGYELSPVDGGRAYQKGGMFGQNLMIIPEENLAVAWTGHRRKKTVDLSRYVLENSTN